MRQSFAGKLKFWEELGRNLGMGQNPDTLFLVTLLLFGPFNKGNWRVGVPSFDPQPSQFGRNLAVFLLGISVSSMLFPPN